MMQVTRSALLFLAIALAGAAFAWVTEITTPIVSVAQCLACGG